MEAPEEQAGKRGTEKENFIFPSFRFGPRIHTDVTGKNLSQ
jgi:hypothetical protein